MLKTNTKHFIQPKEQFILILILFLLLILQLSPVYYFHLFPYFVLTFIHNPHEIITRTRGSNDETRPREERRAELIPIEVNQM